MAYQPLVDYIQQLLQRGYSQEAIKTHLLNSGYAPGMIDDAVQAIYAPRMTVTTAKSHVLLYTTLILGAVLLITFIILIFYFLKPSEIIGEIQLVLTSAQKGVEPGGNIELTTQLRNVPERAKGTVVLQYLLQNKQEAVVASEQESVPIERMGAHTFTFSIKKNIPAEDYVLQTTAKYGQQIFTESVSLTIKAIEKPKSEISSNVSVTPPDDELLKLGKPPQPVTPESTEDCDQDTILDIADLDDDNDDILDSDDTGVCDTDNDGIPNTEDFDDDNDGVPDAQDAKPLDSTVGAGLGQQQILCPNNCNDLDVCTQDSCIGGVCQHTSSELCCGDFICEAGETAETCSMDCVDVPNLGQAERAQQLTQEALAAASTNPENAIASCDAILPQIERDDCFRQIAVVALNPQFCSSIINDRKRDNCYMYFAINRNDANVCQYITDRFIKSSCESLT